MKKLLLIICLFISANAFAQDTNEFFVKNNGDTVYCDIKKIDLDKIKLNSNDILSVDSIKAFLFDNTKWTSYSIEQHNDKKKDTEYKSIFLPQPRYKTDGFKLGNWGKALGTKHDYTISCRTDGKTILYEIDGDFNSGSFSSPASFMFGGGTSTESTIYIKNDELGVAKMHYVKKRSSEDNQKIIEILKKYTADKPQIAKQLENNFSAKYKNVKEYLEAYIQSK